MRVLQQGDLRLRPGSMDDVPAALPWYSDPEVMRGSEATGEPYNAETVGRMYKYLMENGEFYIIEFLEKGKWISIGDVCLLKNSTPIVIGNKIYRSNGIGKRVLSMLVKRALELGWKEMYAKGIYSYNVRSLKLFKSIGFQETGRLERKDGIVEISMKLDLLH